MLDGLVLLVHASVLEKLGASKGTKAMQGAATGGYG